jgi:hypothetical protein
LGREDLAVEPSVHEPTIIDFTFGSVPITVIYSPLDRPNDLLMLCRFGRLPEAPEERSAAMQRLLEVDYVLANSTASLGMDPHSGDVMMSLHNRRLDVTLASLVSTMEMAAERAGLWRETHFLDPGKQSMANFGALPMMA